MSNKVTENLHLLQTLSDKNLSISARQQLAKALPKQAFDVLREIFFNVAIGTLKGFSPRINAQLSKNRLIVFKIVDENQNLSHLERQNFVESSEVLNFLASVLAPILKSILTKSWCREQSDADDDDDNRASSFEIKIEEEDGDDDE